jgi:hypothetical protein
VIPIERGVNAVSETLFCRRADFFFPPPASGITAFDFIWEFGEQDRRGGAGNAGADGPPSVVIIRGGHAPPFEGGGGGRDDFGLVDSLTDIRFDDDGVGKSSAVRVAVRYLEAFGKQDGGDFVFAFVFLLQ